MNQRPLTLSTLADLAQEIVRTGPPRLTLSGPLGVGKTTVAREILRALGVTDAVLSPTFPIMVPYDTSVGRVWHMDLYRLDEVGSALDEEILEHLRRDFWVVEWPERRSAWFAQCLKLHLAFSGSETLHRRVAWG